MSVSKDATVCITGNSLLYISRLQELVRRENGLELCTASGLFADTTQRLQQANPDVVVVAMGEDGHELKAIIESILRTVNAPVIAMAAGNLRLVAEQAGAQDFLRLDDTSSAFGSLEREMVMRIRLASATRAVAPLITTPNALPSIPPLHTGFNGVLALGASTGGTDAILEVIRHLPGNAPGMAIVQHMPSGFTSMYAQRLDRECHMTVIEAKGNHKMEQGLVLLAPGDIQMRVVRRHDGFYTECFDGEKVSGHKPSVDVLFRSVAASAGKNSVGIILTGMGSDGAKGLLEMRRKGAYTIGQNEQSSVVYGMPRVALEIGAVTTQVPLGDVARTLLGHLMKIH